MKKVLFLAVVMTLNMALADVRFGAPFDTTQEDLK